MRSNIVVTKMNLTHKTKFRSREDNDVRIIISGIRAKGTLSECLGHNATLKMFIYSAESVKISLIFTSS